MTEWQFVEDATGKWRWRTSDATGAPRESCKTFKSGADCVAHALRHGYLAGTWLTAGISRSGNRAPVPVQSEPAAG